MTRIPHLPKPVSRVELAARELVGLIRSQPQLQSLPAERSLAAQLGLSRNALREAIRKLELQGLLQIQQGKPTRIVQNLHHPISASLSFLVPSAKNRFLQLFELREILEPKAAALAASRATASNQRDLRKSFALLETAVSSSEFVSADLAFHRSIAKASRNRLLPLILESLIDPLGEAHAAGFKSLRSSDPHPLTLHKKILNSIESRQPVEAEKAMCEHLASARKILGLN